MKVLLASNSETNTLAVTDVIGGAKNGCSELAHCSIEQSPERVAQYRPDVVVMEVGQQAGVSGAGRVEWDPIAEVQETHAARILALGPSTDARLILETLNAGAYRYIDIDRLNEELPTALRKIRTEPPLAVEHGRVISVLGASGGCGASTIAINIAATFCRGGHQPILIDLNLEGGDLAALLRLQPSHSLAEFCQNVNRMDTQMFEKCLVTQKKGVALLPPPLRYQDIAKVTPRGVRKAITMARNQFPYVVIDVDRSYRTEHAQALFQSDMIVVVVRLDVPSVRHAGRVLSYIHDLGIGRDRVRLVANRTTGRGELRERDVEAALKMPVALVVPEGARHLSRAGQRGVPLVADRPRSAVAQVLSNLAFSLNGKLT